MNTFRHSEYVGGSRRNSGVTFKSDQWNEEVPGKPDIKKDGGQICYECFVLIRIQKGL